MRAWWHLNLFDWWADAVLHFLVSLSSPLVRLLFFNTKNCKQCVHGEILTCLTGASSPVKLKFSMTLPYWWLIVQWDQIGLFWLVLTLWQKFRNFLSHRQVKIRRLAAETKRHWVTLVRIGRLFIRNFWSHWQIPNRMVLSGDLCDQICYHLGYLFGPNRLVKCELLFGKMKKVLLKL